MDKNMKDAKATEILDRIVNNEIYLEKMSNHELIAIIEKLEIYEEVSTALTELSIRDKQAIIPLCNKILLENLGDQYLQSIAFNLLYDSDCEKAIKIIRDKIEQVPPSVLGSIMDNLSTDSLQQFGRMLSPKLIQLIQQRYTTLSDVEKKRICDSYEWFRESYADKL